MRFLLVDRITELTRGERATGVKNVTLSEDFFTHHFAYHPIMPGALMLECLVQLADWLLRESVNFECVAMPSSFESVKFHRLVRPGDQLQLQVEVAGREKEQFQLRGQVLCQGRVAVTARFAMALLPTDNLQPAEEARMIFRMIRGD
jgi:3-hydroxyacyl-[acyl-carrier-protein] dehydratase